jgi:hypothetical protein
MGCANTVSDGTHDAAAVRDAPAALADVPAVDGAEAASISRCDRIYDPTEGFSSTLLFPPATVEAFGDSPVPGDSALRTDATWLGTRALSQPVAVRCAEGVTLPPCTLGRVLMLQLPRGQVLELLLSADVDSSPPLPSGARVDIDFERNRSGSGARLTVNDAMGRLVLAVFSEVGRLGDAWNLGPFSLRVDTASTAPDCLGFQQPMCDRVFAPFPLRVGPAATETFSAAAIPVASSLEVTTAHGRYRLVNRKMLRQLRNICSNPPVVESQFEIVQVSR